MLPTGNYMRFQDDVLEKYDNQFAQDEYITFGVLIADCRQEMAREYILNYLSIFDRYSDSCFDFFIPGYAKYPEHSDYLPDSIMVKNKIYCFNEIDFNNFVFGLNEDFGIRYTYNPMLILMSMQKGRKGTSRHIVIELDRCEYGIQRSGQLFELIFETARTNPNIDNLGEALGRTYVRGNLLDIIVNSFGQDWLTQIRETHNEVARYRINS